MFQKKILYTCLLLLLVGGKLFSQVNLQTGSANFSLPIFDWQDEKSRLYAGVSLSYSSGNGLRVNDVASNVGTGWNVMAGGFINRIQAGEPDDQVAYNGNGSEHDIRKYPNGFLYATANLAMGCPDALRKYPLYTSKNQVYIQHNSVAEDKQIDYFSFQFNGKSGIFVLDKLNGDFGLSLGDSKLKISFVRDAATMNSQGIRTTIKSFTIKDVDGLIYKFTQLGTTKVLELNYCDASLTQRQTMPKFKKNKVYHQSGFVNSTYVNPWVADGWYLTEIEDALTGRKIYLNYVNRSINTIAGEDITYNWEGEYAIISHKRSITNTPELTSISYPDGHTLTMNYGASRFDMTGQQVVSSIDVSYQGRYLSRHVLNTSYFIQNRYGTPVSDYQKKVARLCLLSVQQIGPDLKEDAPAYKFDYYTGSNTTDDVVPPPFTYAKDVWGFYNGNNSQGYNYEAINITTPASSASTQQLAGLCFIRNNVTGVHINPKTGYAKNGLLKQIVYPTGGTLSYNYEQNSGVLTSGGPVTNVGGVHVSSTSSTDGGYSNGCANPITTNYNYVMNGVGSAPSLWGLELPLNKITSSSHYEPEKRVYKYKLSCLPLGCCEFKYQYPGILSQNQSISLSTIQRIMIAIAPVLSIVSTAMMVLDVIKLIAGSTGPLGVILDIVASIVGLALTCFNNPTKDKTVNSYYNSDLNGISPLPTQFKRVEVVENPGTIGKTVHEFTSSDDYAIWEPTNPTFSQKQRFAPWAYGLSKLVTIYDASGNKLRQTQNNYNFSPVKTALCGPFGGDYESCGTVTACKCDIRQTTSQRITDWVQPSKYDDPATYRTEASQIPSQMGVDFYNFYTGRVELQTSYDRTYRTTDPTQYVETVKNFHYNFMNFEIDKITTTQSNGDQTIDNTFWITNYGGGIYTTLNNAGIINIPVGKWTTFIKSGTSTEKYLLENEKQFIQLANGDIKIDKIWERRSNQPYSLLPTAPPSFITQAFTYDNSGNMIGVKDEGNRQVTNIYDYQDKYVVASVINSDPLLDASSYSSFESYGFGNWQLSGVGPQYGTGGVTGTRCFNLNGNTFTKPSLNTSKQYILSFWSNNSNVIVGGSAVLVKSTPVVNGFTYYEYELAQGLATVTLSGNSLIDELRLYPKTARMRTVTYDIIYGKTSDCDENNRITYYTYDNLGRLQLIKDEKGNIIKMYEYNNVSEAKQNGCPVIYYNKLISEEFTKNNCAPGYIGGSVTYSVPANTYSSTISQWMADLQAEYQLLANGQAYANTNGACIQVYYNTVQSVTVTTENCPEGYVGGNVTYTVPAGTYSSIISQQDANDQAQDDIDANAQAYANDPAHVVCNVDTNPLWEWDNIHSYCLTINGQLPAHWFILEVDVNPNSSTYNQTRWHDTGPGDACDPNTYFSQELNMSFSKNDCSSGGGTSVNYNVPPGKYSSTVSQAAADQQAINEANANGQAYANANGTCCTPTFSFAPGLSPIYVNVSLINSRVNFTIVVNYPSGMTSFNLGQINPSCCYPNATRIVPYQTGSSVFNVIISTTGAVSVQLVSGPIPTTAVGFTGSYHLTATTYYSVAKSGNFTRNNCPSGQVGSTVTYTVNANAYYSIVSQAAADQAAQDDVNNNGQNYANNNGTCTVSCSFTPTGGMSFYTTSISSSGGNGNFNFVFPSPNSSYSGGFIGTISTGCRPSAARTVYVTDGATPSRTWRVDITTGGGVTLTLWSGSPASNMGGPPVVCAGSYAL